MVSYTYCTHAIHVLRGVWCPTRTIRTCVEGVQGCVVFCCVQQMEKKLEQVQAENTALQERLAALTSSMEELRMQSAQKESDLQSREDSRRQAAEDQLDQVRRQLSDMEKQLALEQEHNKIKEEALKEKDKQLEELSAKSEWKDHHLYWCRDVCMYVCKVCLCF